MKNLLDATLCEQKNMRRLLIGTMDQMWHPRDDVISAPTKNCNIPMFSSHPEGEAQARVSRTGVSSEFKQLDAGGAACPSRFVSM
mmetsp:Transcript_123071/g.212924  ORF Transcript_123071/g.212924 Transcript_123071/m.212924 type:complete len:85 (-) Transcript_123071:124-378(-)